MTIHQPDDSGAIAEAVGEPGERLRFATPDDARRSQLRTARWSTGPDPRMSRGRARGAWFEEARRQAVGLLSRLGKKGLKYLGLDGPKAVISLTIEHGLVKLVVSRGLEVLEYRVVVANPKFFKEGLVSEPRRMANVLRRALAELTTEEGPVVGAVPGYQSSLQSLSLPRARGMDPSVVIPREARRRMGVSAERSHLVWHRLVDGIGVTNWLVLSASRRSVASISTMAGTAGLRVHSFELRPFALARAVDQPEAIIAWTAADGCEVSIVRDWVPVATQTAYWGATPPVEGDILVNRIAEVVERALVICEQESLDSSLPDDTPIYVTGSPLSLEPDVAGRVAAALDRPLRRIEPPMPPPPPPPDAAPPPRILRSTTWP